MRLGRSAICHYCLDGCSALVVCARRSRLVWGASDRYLVSCLPRFPLSAPRVLRCVRRAVPSGCPLPSLAGTPFHAACAFRGLGRVALLVFPACPLCVCALALTRRALPPPPPAWCGARSARIPGAGRWYGRSTRSLPLCESCPGPVLRLACLRGWGPVPFPPYLAWGCALPVGWVCASGAFLCRGMGWGGGGCAPCPLSVRPGGPVGREVALPRSVPLPSLGRQQRECHWRRSGHGGLGPHTAPVRARLPSPGAVRVAPWQVGAGSSVLRGSCESRRLGRGGGPFSGLPLGRRGPAGGRGDDPLSLGGWGRRPRGLRAGGGGWGDKGGVALWPPCSPSGGRPAAPYPAPLLSPAHSRPVCAFGRGCGAAPCAGCGLPGGEGGGGAPRKPPPRRLRQTQSVPLPSLRRLHCGCHWRCSGHGGRGPQIVPVRRRVPPPGVVRASLWSAGAGSPAGRDPRGSRRWGALGREACGSSSVPHRASRFLPGEGGRPVGPGGAEGRCPRGSRAGGGARGEKGGRGGRAAAPRPPRPVGWPVAPVPVTLCLRRAPLGYTRAVRVAGRPCGRCTSWSAASWSVWRGGGG